MLNPYLKKSVSPLRSGSASVLTFSWVTIPESLRCSFVFGQLQLRWDVMIADPLAQIAGERTGGRPVSYCLQMVSFSVTIRKPPVTLEISAR
jgi:hypothetical protein